MVVQDGTSFVSALPGVLNNLIFQGRLPVMIVILISPGPGDALGSERGLEYDTLSDDYVAFIESEVLPLVEQNAGVTLTGDPEGRATMGWSSGGAAAFTMGWQCPSLSHRILTYSGTFVNAHPDDQNPHGAWEYLEHLIADSDPKPLRVFLEVGSQDLNSTDDASTYRNWVLANQRMAAALAAKGYHYRFLLPSARLISIPGSSGRRSRRRCCGCGAATPCGRAPLRVLDFHQQATAQSFASSSTSSFRGAPFPGSSLSARSSPSSRKRCFVR